MINSFDAGLYRLINQQLTSESLDPVMYWLSDKYFWIPLYLVMIGLIIAAYKKYAVVTIAFLFLSVLASDRLTSGLMKPLIGRPRPCLEQSLTPRIIEGVHCSETGSMASSHAANHFAIAVFMILLYGVSKRSNTMFWLIWALAISYSRVYLGVHYPTDVLVGGIVGALCGYASFRLYRYTAEKIESKK